MKDPDPNENYAAAPINLRGQQLTAESDTGFLIVRLKPDSILNQYAELRAAAKEAGLAGLSQTLAAFSLEGNRLVTSVAPERLRLLERKAPNKDFESTHSLADYWRVDVRNTPQKIEEIEKVLQNLPGVDLVYREKAVTDPVMPADDLFSGLEHFLDAAPIGVDVRWFWTQPHGAGEGMHFIDLEQGWIDHEDLAPFQVVFNDNRDGHLGFFGDHGSAVVAIIAGLDNDRGIIGMAPKVESVRAISHWNKTTGDSPVADAITAAIDASPPPDVLLLEVETYGTHLPAETDSATLTAIRLAVAHGIIVVAAAGNGNTNLDGWQDAEKKFRLNRNSPDFQDSGAILVGAATAHCPHNRSIWDGGLGSNYGSRVNCYAWGDSIVTVGYGSLGGFGKTSYTDGFAGTSGSSPIIAGCALLLQGRHLQLTGSRLLPEDMRKILSNPATGTPQGPDVPGSVGVMPNLKAIVTNGA
jgi:subtilisin family serine protease